MKRFGLLLLLFAGPLPAQKVTLPKELVADSPLVILRAETDCLALKWAILDPGISMIPIELLRDTKTAILVSGKQGRFRVAAWGALAGVASDLAICTVIVGSAPIPPIPPVPPDPLPVTVIVPSVIGKNYVAAGLAVMAAGLTVEVVGDISGVVAQQNPAAGAKAAKGDAVTLAMTAPLPTDPLTLAIRDALAKEAAPNKVVSGQKLAELYNAASEQVKTTDKARVQEFFIGMSDAAKALIGEQIPLVRRAIADWLKAQGVPNTTAAALTPELKAALSKHFAAITHSLRSCCP